MVLRNYVELPQGQPVRLHFTGGELVAKTIFDPVLAREKPVNTLVLAADEMDGKPVGALLSITSEKFAVQLYSFLQAGTLAAFDFVIIRTGDRFTTSYSVEPIARRG